MQEELEMLNQFIPRHSKTIVEKFDEIWEKGVAYE